MHCLFGPGAAYLLMNMGASPFFIFSGCFLRMIRHFLPIILSKSFRRSDCITYTTYDYDSGFWCGMYKVENCYCFLLFLVHPLFRLTLQQYKWCYTTKLFRFHFVYRMGIRSVPCGIKVPYSKSESQNHCSEERKQRSIRFLPDLLTYYGYWYNQCTFLIYETYFKKAFSSLHS